MRPQVIALLAMLLVLPTALGAWTMEGGDAGHSNTVTVAIPTEDIALAWGAPGQFTGILVAADGSVIATGDPVSAFEADGTQRWSTRTVGAQQQVYRARGTGAILSDGTIVTQGSLPFGAPAVVGYDPATGAQKFVNKNITGSCDSVEEGAIAVAADDTFFIGSCGPGIVAFWPNGTMKWSVAAHADRVALSGANVIAEVEDHKLPNGTTYEDAIVALKQADGSFVWAAKLEDGNMDPLVARDGTIVTVDAGRVTAISPTDGALKWATLVPRPFAIGVAPNGTIAAASSNTIAWLAPADGKLLGSSPTKDGRTLLVGAGAHLRAYGATAGSTLAAIDPNGNVVWEVVRQKAFQSNVALGPSGSFYIAEDGMLLAFEGAGGATPPPTTAGSPAITDAAPTVHGDDAPGGDGVPAPGVALLLVALALLAVVRRR